MTTKPPINVTDGKMDLNDLISLPQSQFEDHFRKWMERDDVARSLQAKLRTDLIMNFNNTALGKHIISQTTMSTSAYPGSSKRLTLSPLVLALNTLVAEFLYAQNCHFSLSVFCTEVPFRNTLPEFESMKYFRFSDEEITDIFEAISRFGKFDKDLRTHVTKRYSENTTISLLLLILKGLIDKITKETSDAKHHIPTIERETQTNSLCPLKKSISNSTNDKSIQSDRDQQVDIYNTNLRYLNKYLIILSKKVGQMSQQFENLQQEQFNAKAGNRPRLRISKSTGFRKYENLNRSLERATENLRLMSQAKQKGKHVQSIIAAIDGLSNQFAKCVKNFEDVRSGLKDQGLNKQNKPGNEDCISAQSNSHPKPIPETKSYTDWVNDLRLTHNGQKFLYRVEVTLRKALYRQRDKLQKETILKLRRQGEMLRAYYKRKLAKKLSQSTGNSEEAPGSLDDNVQEKLKNFEEQHKKLYQKVTETEAEVKQMQKVVIQKKRSYQSDHEGVPQSDNISLENQDDSRAKMPATSVSSTELLNEEFHDLLPFKQSSLKDIPSVKFQPFKTSKIFSSLSREEDVVDEGAQNELQEAFQNIFTDDRKVDEIVTEAKLRLKDLEMESKMLEVNFTNYLQHQKHRTTSTRETIAKVWDNFEKDREKMLQRLAYTKSLVLRKSHSAIELKDPEIVEDVNIEIATDCNQENSDQVQPAGRKKSTSIFTIDSSKKNAILEAKERFFDGERKFHEFLKQQREWSLDAPLEFVYKARDRIDQVPNELNDCLHYNTNPLPIRQETEFSSAEFLGSTANQADSKRTHISQLLQDSSPSIGKSSSNDGHKSDSNTSLSNKQSSPKVIAKESHLQTAIDDANAVLAKINGKYVLDIMATTSFHSILSPSSPRRTQSAPTNSVSEQEKPSTMIPLSAPSILVLDSMSKMTDLLSIDHELEKLQRRPSAIGIQRKVSNFNQNLDRPTDTFYNFNSNRMQTEIQSAIDDLLENEANKPLMPSLTNLDSSIAPINDDLTLFRVVTPTVAAAYSSSSSSSSSSSHIPPNIRTDDTPHIGTDHSKQFKSWKRDDSSSLRAAESSTNHSPIADTPRPSINVMDFMKNLNTDFLQIRNDAANFDTELNADQVHVEAFGMEKTALMTTTNGGNANKLFVEVADDENPLSSSIELQMSTNKGSNYQETTGQHSDSGSDFWK